MSARLSEKTARGGGSKREFMRNFDRVPESADVKQFNCEAICTTVEQCSERNDQKMVKTEIFHLYVVCSAAVTEKQIPVNSYNAVNMPLLIVGFFSWQIKIFFIRQNRNTHRLLDQ